MIIAHLPPFGTVGDSVTPEEYMEQSKAPAMSYEQAMRSIVEYYGGTHQITKAIEELAELQKELAVHLGGAWGTEAIADEMADVEIILEQLKIIFGNAGTVAERVVYKLNRQLERMSREGNSDEKRI